MTSAILEPQTFNEVTNHPAGYSVLLLFNVVWLCTVIMLLIGVVNFNPHLMRPHIAIQTITIVVCVIMAVIMSIQLAIGVSDNAQNGPVEEITTLVSCVMVIFVQSWSIPVVHECMEFFQLCQVLLDLAKKGQGGVNRRKRAVSIISDRVIMDQDYREMPSSEQKGHG